MRRTTAEWVERERRGGNLNNVNGTLHRAPLSVSSRYLLWFTCRFKRQQLKLSGED